ncbi:MAG: hypothetical protein J5570_08215 [Lachnospiraceae bacterium]|nr:hypothetical protein [Lachnospiraceae bacterium]
MGEYAFDDPKKQPKLSDLVPEEHGPLVKIYSSYSGHGMQMGSGTSGNETVTWQEDGSVIIESNDHRDGKEKYEKYLAGAGAAEKLRTFVKENRLAEMAQIEKIPFPYAMTDYSSSSHISFTFADGNVLTERKLDCSSCWILQQDALRKVRELIKECTETGKLLEEKESSYDIYAPGTASFMGMGMLGTGFTGMGMPKTDNTAGRAGTPGSWKCECGQENTGNFCTNCGMARPKMV